MSVAGFQDWLVYAFARATPVAALLRTHWGWPASETVHFIGLTLLFGPVVVWDLRLLGLGRRIPIGALHALVPWVLIGYATTAVSGVAFLMTEPLEYIYNPAFQFKVLFMALAGLNALAFYLTVGRRTLARGADEEAPRAAKVMAVASLFLWLAVIVCGRLLTFYRPGWCGAAPRGWLSTCIPAAFIPGGLP